MEPNILLTWTVFYLFFSDSVFSVFVFHNGKIESICNIFNIQFLNLCKTRCYIYTQVLTLNVVSGHFKSTSSTFDLQKFSLSPNKSKSENPSEGRGRHNNTEPVWMVMVATWYQTVCRAQLNFCSFLIWEREEIWVSLGKHPWQPPACETRPFLHFFVSVHLISADLWVSIMAASQPDNHTNTHFVSGLFFIWCSAALTVKVKTKGLGPMWLWSVWNVKKSSMWH